jgi:hypothetical protein
MQAAKNQSLFVYYKIERPWDDALLHQVRMFQRRLQEKWPGLSCELMRRPLLPSSTHGTWLEIYRHASGLSDQMIEAISELAQAQGLPAPRMAEVFVPFE